MVKNLLITTGLVVANVILAQDKPNIIIVYSDDMGVGDVSFLNSNWVQTPNIDYLASQGLVLTNYYNASPVSSPSRVSITTGMFPSLWGINSFLQTREGNKKHEQFDFLNPKAPSMARTFKDAGYKTIHIGKWHMGGGRDVYDAPQIPLYGFDEYVSTYESPDPDSLITATNWIWSKQDSIKRWERTRYFVDKVLDFIKRNKGEACFVNLWPDDMHTPWIPSVEYYDKKYWTSKETFEKVIVEYDKQIGRLINGLKDIGAWNNTILIFTSDNGPAPSFNQLRTNGLRGLKFSLYEGGIKMPFIISWPEKIVSGKINNKSVVSSVDIYPSLCSMVGIDCPDYEILSGEDMSEVFLKKKKKDRTKDLIWEFGRNDAFSKPPQTEYHRSPQLAIRRGDYKLLINLDGSRLELYNLVDDPYETNNIANKKISLCKELSNKVITWFKTDVQSEESKRNDNILKYSYE